MKTRWSINKFLFVGDHHQRLQVPWYQSPFPSRAGMKGDGDQVGLFRIISTFNIDNIGVLPRRRKNIIIDISNIGQNYQEHKLVSPLSSEQSILSLPQANYQTRGGGIELSDTHAHFPGFNWNILEISDLSFSVKLGNTHLRSCTLHLGIAQTDMIIVTSSTSSASVKYFWIFECWSSSVDPLGGAGNPLSSIFSDLCTAL